MKRHVLLGYVLLLVLCAGAQAADKIKVLIIDGQNNHNWKATTPVLKVILENCERFSVDVSTTPGDAPRPPQAPKGEVTPDQKAAFEKAQAEWKAKKAEHDKAAVELWNAWKPNFSGYQVVLMNYTGADWPQSVQKDFFKFVNNGGGLVIYHAADNAFPKWHEFNEMIGVGGWGGRNEKSGPMLRLREGKWTHDMSPGPGGTHGPQHEFVVATQAPDHPIMKGLPPQWMHAKDELYSKLRGPAKNLTVLASAFADPNNKGSGEHEPMLMAITFGKGRIFHTALGHDQNTCKGVGFQVTLQRGTEWAATGSVTLPLPPADLLPADKPVYREPEQIKP